MKQTIILGSDNSFVLNTDFKINGKDKSQVKWAYITTAGNDVPVTDYLLRAKEGLDKLGWDYEEYDIAGKSAQEISVFLKSKDAIFMQGGNTYYLLRQAQICNLKSVLEKFLAEGKVYVGASAGSYIMCPDIEAMNWKDSSRFNKHGLTDLKALGFVPFRLFCHFNRHLDDQENIKELVKQSEYPAYTINDGEGILVEDGDIKFIK